MQTRGGHGHSPPFGEMGVGCSPAAQGRFLEVAGVTVSVLSLWSESHKEKESRAHPSPQAPLNPGVQHHTFSVFSGRLGFRVT